MVKQLIQIFMVASLMVGCALKDSDLSQSGLRSGVRSGFIPNEIRRNFNGKTFALIDVLNMPSGSYTINNTKVATGGVHFPYDFPIFTATPCSGIGYTIAYERRFQGATSLIRIVPFVNGNEIFVERFLVSKADSLSLGVYVELAPIEPFFERGELPSNFIGSFLPSNNCKSMCDGLCMDSVRPLVNAGCDIQIFDWVCGKRVLFTPLADYNERLFWLGRLANCGAVSIDSETGNNDLKAYYEKAASSSNCIQNKRRIYDEWYVVQHKVPFLAPVYTIKNIKEIASATSDTQNQEISNRPVARISEWR